MNQDLLTGRETNSIIKEMAFDVAFDVEIYATFNKQSTIFGFKLSFFLRLNLKTS